MRLRERYQLSFKWRATVLPLEVFLNFGVARHEAVYLGRQATAVGCGLVFSSYGGRKSLGSRVIDLLLRRIQIWCLGTRKREELTDAPAETPDTAAVEKIRKQKRASPDAPVRASPRDAGTQKQ